MYVLEALRRLRFEVPHQWLWPVQTEDAADPDRHTSLTIREIRLESQLVYPCY